MSKKIKFISNIRQGGETQTISFESSVQVGNYDSFQTYEFKEPSMQVMNRIEVSETHANIFAGQSTINLILDKTLKIQYQTPHGILLLDSHMSYMNCSDPNNISFQYSLSNDGEVVGSYEIKLQISA